MHHVNRNNVQTNFSRTCKPLAKYILRKYQLHGAHRFGQFTGLILCVLGWASGIMEEWMKKKSFCWSQWIWHWEHIFKFETHSVYGNDFLHGKHIERCRKLASLSHRKNIIATMTFAGDAHSAPMPYSILISGDSSMVQR